MQFQFNEDYLCEWIMESPVCFRTMVWNLREQILGKEGSFVLSEKDEILNIPKSMEMILNPFSTDVNEKRILNRIYQELAELSCREDNYYLTQEFKQQVLSYLYELENQCDYAISINPELDFSFLLKAAGVKLEVCEGDFLSTLLQYIEVVYSVLKKKLFVLVNIRSYLSDSQMKELIQMIKYREIPVLLVENKQRDCFTGVHQYIIDADQCEIY